MKPGSTFTTDTPSLLAKTLAEHLMYDLVLFGRMGAANATRQANTESLLHKRASVTVKFLQALEIGIGLKFAPESNMAFCRLRTTVDLQRTNMFGYTGCDDDPLPSEVALSLLGFWHGQTAARRTPIEALAAIVCCVHEHGYPAALRYLYDLNESGYLGGNAFELLNRALVFGRGASKSDVEFVRRFIGDWKIPEAQNDWLSQPLNTSWWSDLQLNTPAAPGLLIEFSWDEINKLRTCDNIDEWAAQVYSSWPALLNLGGLFDSGRGSLAERAARAQLSEMFADLPLPGFASQGIGLLTLIGCVVLANLASTQAGEEWYNRVFAERAVVPRLVFDGISGTDQSWPSISQERWTRLSWRVISSWMASFRSDESVGLKRSSYDGIGSMPADAEDCPDLMKALARAGEHFSQSRHQDMCDELQSALRFYPYSGQLYALLAVAYDSLGRFDAALESVLPAIVLMPRASEFWKIGARVAYLNGCESDAILLDMFGSLIDTDDGSMSNAPGSED